MSDLVVPKGYAPVLSIYETQTAIGILKRRYEDGLCRALNLKRVSAPLFVEPQTGLNDDLNGVERPVDFESAKRGATCRSCSPSPNGSGWRCTNTAFLWAKGCTPT